MYWNLIYRVKDGKTLLKPEGAPVLKTEIMEGK